MKRLIAALMAFALFCFCMSGCQANQEKQEQNSKAAIREHLDTIHGLSVRNYESFRLNEDCSASATVKVTVALEGLGSMEMSCELRLDESCQITSCSLCNMGIGYNGGAQDLEGASASYDDVPDLGESSTVYQSYIIDTAEQLTGFSISVEMGNYREQEIVESGHSYIDIFAFINIEEMAGTAINSSSSFQLYALINPDNKEDLFIVITGNSTGEIYRYDNTSIPHETAASSSGSNYEDSSNSLSYEKQLFTVFLHSTYNGYEMSVTAEQGEAMPACDPPYGDSTVKFMGYFSGENGSGTQYYDENMNSVHNWDKTSDGELYAYWLKDYSITPENFQDYFEVRIIGQRIGDDVLTLDYEIVPKSNFDWNGAESSDTISATMRIDVTADLSQSGCDSSYDTQITIDFNLMKSDQYMYSGTEALTFPSTWGCYTTPTITQCSGSVEKIW
jgi:hypothetical protein